MPKTIVYNLTHHPILQCYLPVPYIADQDKSGELGYMIKKATTEVIASFQSLRLGDSHQTCLQICEDLTDEQLHHRFIKSKRAKLAKLMADPKTAKPIKATISRQVNEFLSVISEHQLPLCMGVKRKVKLEDLKVIPRQYSLEPQLTFEKSDTGIHYTLSLAIEGQRPWHPADTESLMVCDQPGWAIFDRQLFKLNHINGNKLKPFLNKKTITIPNHLSHTYLEKFVQGLITKVKVDVIGFTLAEYENKPKAILRTREDFIAEQWILDLLFEYGEETFHYWAKEDKRTRLHYEEHDAVRFSVTRRQQQEEEKIINVLESYNVIADKTNRLVFSQASDDPFQALHWLQQHKGLLEERGIDIELPQINQHTLSKHQAEITMSQVEENDWFDIRAVVTIGTQQIPFAHLIDHIKSHNRVFELENGEAFIIPLEWMTQYASLARFAKVEDTKVSILKSQFGILKEEDSSDDESLRIYEAPTEDAAFIISPLLKATLRPYQQAGIQWLVNHQQNGLGCCLADDMGLGKTVQSIAAILAAIENQDENSNDNVNEIVKENENENEKSIESGAMQFNQGGVQSQQLDLFGMNAEIKPVLLQQESQQKEPKTILTSPSTPASQAGKLNTHHLPRRQASSTLIIMPASLIFNWQAECQKFAPHLFVKKHTGPDRAKTKQGLLTHDIILTSYQTALRDINLLEEVDWLYVILDESQYIKNPASKIFSAIQNLQADHKISLSGTPIENSLSDLWAQMQFINPDILGSYTFFKKHFQKPIEKDQDESLIDELKSLTKPFLLRRTKQEVLSDLPEKTEQIMYCEMSEAQLAEYDTEKNATRNMILQSDLSDPQVKIQILSSLLRLRQLANHPILYKSDYKKESGKFNIIKESLEKVRKSGHKALIFSSFTKHLDLVGDYLKKDKIPFVELTGKTTLKNRQKAVTLFQENQDIAFFLISIKAGGTGLNLTAANYVFILDPWWNPFVEEQAIARAHRIGLKHPLSVIKFISNESIEEKILKLQQKKLKLSEEFIETGEKMSWTQEELGYLLE